MNVSLPPQLEALIAQKVKSGRYGSATDVVQEALRLLDERDTAETRLREELRIGREQAERGETITAEELFSELERRQNEIEFRQKR